MGKIQEVYPLHFSNYKARYTQRTVQDVTDPSEQETIMIETHNRAHRNYKENKEQIIEEYFFPSMLSKLKTLAGLCVICKENKYDRHPNKPELGETPIPQYPGHTVHFDIFITDKNLVLTSLDKFSKCALARVLKSRSVEDVRKPLRELLFSYGVPKSAVIDNEKSLNSANILYMMKNELKIDVYTTPPYKSEVNGQVERFHSTLAEIIRCIKHKNIHRDFEDLLQSAVNEYNHTIHSVTKRKPIDIFFNRTIHYSPSQYEKTRKSVLEKLQDKQKKDLDYHNKKREKYITYRPGEIVYVRQNKRLGTKLSKRYKRGKVKENFHTIIKTESGKIVHKSNIRN